MKISGEKAFSSTLKNKFRKYPDRSDDRFQNQFIYPEFEPSFGISKSQAVFTIGSCFARNVETVLLSHGLSVPTAHFTAPQEEAPGRPNRILNQYNPGTMLQCVQEAMNEINDKGQYEVSEHEVIDCLLATGSRPVSKGRALERRQQINDLYANGLKESEFVIITLGLVEAWYDKLSSVYLNEAPPRKLIISEKDRFEFRQLGVEECKHMVFEMLDLLIQSGRRKVVLTVSPVPLQVTFAGGDAVVRNAYSKSILRVVAELATQEFDGVDYYPSYETVMSGGPNAFGADNVHIRPVVVERVVSRMVSLYIS